MAKKVSIRVLMTQKMETYNVYDIGGKWVESLPGAVRTRIHRGGTRPDTVSVSVNREDMEDGRERVTIELSGTGAERFAGTFPQSRRSSRIATRSLILESVY